jgi:Glyoxalase-like domain
VKIDHIFICCAPGGPEADALLQIGLVEGSRNVHPGQGTENRRFFFESGFIELLWVDKPSEAQSELTSPTRLWPRWSERQAGACPFGVAFSPSGSEMEPTPFTAWDYKPRYLPAGKSIHFATGTSLSEPELFYLAWANTSASAASSSAQPINHTVSLRTMRSVSVGTPHIDALSESAKAAAATGLISFYGNETFELTVEFSAPQASRFDLRPRLPLILIGAA